MSTSSCARSLSSSRTATRIDSAAWRASIVAFGLCVSFDASTAFANEGLPQSTLGPAVGYYPPNGAPDRIATGLDVAGETADEWWPLPSQLAARPFAREIDAAAREYGIDPALVHVVVQAESGYRQDIMSPRGAVGLMQILPETGARYGIDPAESARANLRAGARYLRDLMKMFNAQLDLVFAAYNAGEGSVRKYGNRVPPFPETQKYVRTLLGIYASHRPPRLTPRESAKRTPTLAESLFKGTTVAD
jgi:hypothetical protein